MSNEMQGLVTQCYDDRSLADYALAVYLANCSDWDGSSIFPKVETMAAFGRQGKRTASRNVAAMLDCGWLELVAPAYHHRPPEYRINPVWIANAYAALGEGHKKLRRGDGKKPQIRIRVPAPGRESAENRDATMASHENEAANDANRDATMAPHKAPAGMPSATGRDANGDTTYIGDPSLTLSPQPPRGEGDAFDRLLGEYPAHRQNIKAARRQWDKLAPDQALQQWILEAARTQARQARWQADEGRAVPNLSKWLANEQWRATPQHKPEAPAAQTAVIRKEGAPPAATPIEPSEAREAARAKLRELRQQHSATAAARRIA